MSRQIHCKVGYCRYKFTHATQGHICGRCAEKGHGDYECTHYMSRRLKEVLKQYFDDILPDNMHCTVSDCKDKQYHTKEAHHCPHCGKREQHTMEQCSKKEKTYNLRCPDCRTEHRNIKLLKIYCKAECGVCLTNNIDISLPCGHTYCTKCINRIAQ
jgi:hypothetical protein